MSDKEPLSYFRNSTIFLAPNVTQGVILHTPPVPELQDEEWLALAQFDGYAVIPIEAYRALRIFEQLFAFYKQVGDGQICPDCGKARLTA